MTSLRPRRHGVSCVCVRVCDRARADRSEAAVLYVVQRGEQGLRVARTGLQHRHPVPCVQMGVYGTSTAL